MKRLLASVLAVMALGGIAHADPAGQWRVADGSAIVQIKKCGGNFCGYVVSTRDPAGKDVKNPDPAKRNRSVLGIEVLFALKPSGDNVWKGFSYNADDGLTYTATVTMTGDNSLKIEGCVPNGGMCGRETWSRAN
ncbi:DUF2147 domain-containing protein [Beijerinckia mobilis]|uniref:DUF2147 domain-containing protein n=1 Tax=Beijerinckia mobilis TaxID=231434 RepID=UPI00054D3F39|nr:DUF2147 domain-containing protein [Beijerinckia mobilis]